MRASASPWVAVVLAFGCASRVTNHAPNDPEPSHVPKPSQVAQAAPADVVAACPSAFSTDTALDGHYWSFTITCTEEEAAGVKITIARLEHDDNHQIVGTLVEDLWLPPGDIDPARTGVEEGPDLAHYAVLNARNGTSFRYVYYKKEARTEERRSRVTIPFARSSDAKAFVKALARPTR